MPSWAACSREGRQLSRAEGCPELLATVGQASQLAFRVGREAGTLDELYFCHPLKSGLAVPLQPKLCTAGAIIQVHLRNPLSPSVSTT